MAPFHLVVPPTEADAFAALRGSSDGAVTVLAGGTDLLLDIDLGRAAPTTVVSLRRLSYDRLAWNGPSLRIGSTLPLRALERDSAVRGRFPALYDALTAVGGPALRHRATLGGNLGRAAPASDLLPVLLVLDATVELVSEAGAREVTVDRFLRTSRRPDLRPGELIRSVRLPEPRPSAYLWQRVRPANDISQIAVAVAYAPRAARWKVALGGVPPRPVLIDAAALALAEARPTPAAVDRAAALVAGHESLPGDRRATEEYRRDLVAMLLRRAVRDVVARSGDLA